MRPRALLQSLGIAAIAFGLLVSGCSQAGAPAPTPVPTQLAAAVATAVPPAPAATTVPTAVPSPAKAAATVAPTKPVATAAPTKPAATARPATSPTAPRTPTVPAPTKPAAPTKAAGTTPTRTPTPAALPLLQAPQGAQDCGSDLACFIDASKKSQAAKVDYTMSVDFFGLFTANTDTLIIKGREGNNLLFSQQTIAADASITEQLVASMQARGIPDAEVAKMITTAAGIAELMKVPLAGLTADQEKQLNTVRETQRARIGTGKDCKFPQPALTAMLERWQKGQYSSSDYDGGQCTNIQASAAPSSGSSPTAEPTAFSLFGRATPTPSRSTGVAPAKIGDIPVPDGFDFQGGGGESDSNGNFTEGETYSGNATMQAIADFYASRLTAAVWDSRGGVVGDSIVDVKYEQKNTSPLITLLINAEPENGAVRLEIAITNRPQ